MAKSMAQVMTCCSLQGAMFTKEEAKNEVINTIIEAPEIFKRSMIENALDSFINAYEAYMEENLRYNWNQRYQVTFLLMNEKEFFLRHLDEMLNTDLDDDKIIEIIDFIQTNM